MPTKQEIIKKFATFKANPEMAMFQFMQQMERDFKTQKKEMREELREELLEEIQQKDPSNAGFIEKIVSKLVKDSKGDRGEAGSSGFKGDRGDKGEQGLSGLLGLQGKQGSQGARGFKGQKGEKGKQGPPGPKSLDGKDGKDGSPDNPSDIRIKLESLVGDSRLAASAIKGLDKMVQNFGGRTLHRGGLSIIDGETPSGTVNGSNTVFTLANTPKSGTERVYVGGIRFKGGGEDYTISGSTITFNTAPPTGAILLVDYQEN